MRNTNQTEQTFSQNFILEDSLRVKVSRTPHTHRIEWVCKIHRDSKSKAVWLPHTRCDGMQKAMYTWSDDRILEQTNFERTGEKPFFGRSLWTTRTTQKKKQTNISSNSNKSNAALKIAVLWHWMWLLSRRCDLPYAVRCESVISFAVDEFAYYLSKTDNSSVLKLIIYEMNKSTLPKYIKHFVAVYRVATAYMKQTAQVEC